MVAAAAAVGVVDMAAVVVMAEVMEEEGVEAR